MAHVDIGPHGRLVKNAGLSRAACGATELVGDNRVLDQQNVDLLGEQHFPSCGTSVASVDPGLLPHCQPES